MSLKNWAETKLYKLSKRAYPKGSESYKRLYLKWQAEKIKEDWVVYLYRKEREAKFGKNNSINLTTEILKLL